MGLWSRARSTAFLAAYAAAGGSLACGGQLSRGEKSSADAGSQGPLDGSIRFDDAPPSVAEAASEDAPASYIEDATLDRAPADAALDQPPLAPPTFSPMGGQIILGSTVTVVCASPPGVRVVIFFTTDGSAPSSSSQEAVGPLQVTASETIRAICSAPGSGFSDSPVSSQTYEVPPCSGSCERYFGLSPTSTTSNNDFLVSASDSTNVTVCIGMAPGTAGPWPTCSPDGGCSDPSQTYNPDARLGSPGSISITGAVTDPASGKVAVTATACDPIASPGFSQTYELRAADPTMQRPPPGALDYSASGWKPTMASVTTGATLRFTTDGTLPTCAAGTLLVDALQRPTNSGTVVLSQSTSYTAISCKPGYAQSNVVTFVYTVAPAPDAGNVDGAGHD